MDISQIVGHILICRLEVSFPNRESANLIGGYISLFVIIHVVICRSKSGAVDSGCGVEAYLAQKIGAKEKLNHARKNADSENAVTKLASTYIPKEAACFEATTQPCSRCQFVVSSSVNILQPDVHLQQSW